MPWRHTTRAAEDYQLSMVIRRLGWKATIQSGIHHSEWHQIIVRIFPVILGVTALATTLLLGSFLWGFVSKKNKNKNKNQKKSTTFADLYPRASHKPNTVVALREFAKPFPSSSPKVADCDSTLHFDALVFDPEQDYAQVLAEAKSHAAATKKRPPESTPPFKRSPVFSDAKHQWLPRSSSARSSRSVFEDFEAVVAQQSQDAGSQGRFRSSKSWKKLLFWKKSKTTDQFEFNVVGAVHSSCSTPLHYIFKSSKTRATVAPSTPTNSSKKQPIPKRTSSGPLYTDGSPLTPSRTGRSFSGPLSASSTPSRDGLFESPYMPLKKPCSTPKTSSGPLYVP